MDRLVSEGSSSSAASQTVEVLRNYDSTAIHTESLRSLNELSPWYRCCVVTIVNDTRYDLICGQSAMTSGEVHRRVPETIKSGHFDIILSRKTSYSLKGVVGMVSYEMSGHQPGAHMLQIAWHVPWDLGTLYDVYFNVNLGRTMASRTEVYKLLYNIQPAMRRRASEYTPGTFDVGGFRFEVGMLNTKQSMLTVTISELKTN